MIPINPLQILFLDIETATEFPDLDSAPEQVRHEWMKKMQRENKFPAALMLAMDSPDADDIQRYNETADDLYQGEGALHPEFSRVLCVSVGYIASNGTLNVKCIFDEDEKVVLNKLADTLEKHCGPSAGAGDISRKRLCAHHGIGFDFPFLGKRYMINRIKLPGVLNSYGKKPWEVSHVDTKDIWKMGGYNSASLSTLCMCFGIPTPKDDIDGSQVGRVWHEENDLPRIAKYCDKDVVSLALVFLKMCYDENEYPVTIHTKYE